MSNKQKKLGLFPLTALVISSSIGGGIFDISKDMGPNSSPGAALIAWLIVGCGVLTLCLSITNLTEKRPELSGLFSYAQEGFGPFGGFISGWGYWLSAWLGNVAFATLMMSAVGYFIPAFGKGNNILSILCASIILWLMNFLVNRGVESAAILNAIITVCKVVPLFLFIVIAISAFKPELFGADFWRTPSGGFETLEVFSQIQKSMMVLMWVFVGIEGAAMMGDRAERKSIVGKATVLGLIGLLIIYITASILPYGLLTREQMEGLGQPAMAYILEALVGKWGASLVNIAVIISTFGCWLSWTMLPAETTLLMAKEGLLPKKFGTVNEKNSPSYSLLFMGILTQCFIFTLLFTDRAYNFAFSLCTASIFISWLFVVLYQVKFSYERREMGQLIIGVAGTLFYLWAIWASGINYLLLCFTVYILGLFLYSRGRKERGVEKVFSPKEIIVIIFIVIGALISVYLIASGKMKL